MLSDVKEIEAGVQSLELGSKGKLLSFANNFQQLNFAPMFFYCSLKFLQLTTNLSDSVTEKSIV